jgi:hypothetical protein
MGQPGTGNQKMCLIGMADRRQQTPGTGDIFVINTGIAHMCACRAGKGCAIGQGDFRQIPHRRNTAQRHKGGVIFNHGNSSVAFFITKLNQSHFFILQERFRAGQINQV